MNSKAPQEMGDTWQGNLYLGGKGATPEIAADFLMDALFIGDALRNKEKEVQRAAKQDLISLFKSCHNELGVLMQGHSWLVSAKA